MGPKWNPSLYTEHPAYLSRDRVNRELLIRSREDGHQQDWLSALLVWAPA